MDGYSGKKTEIVSGLYVSEDSGKKTPEDLWHKLIETSNNWIHVIDGSGRVFIWNNTAEILSGYKKEEVLGHKKIWELLYPDTSYRRMVFTTGRIIMNMNKGIRGFETTITCKSGDKRIIQWSGSSYLENGQVAWGIAIGEDVTGRKETEQNILRLASFPEMSPTILFETDLQGGVIYQNPAARDALRRLGFGENDGCRLLPSNFCGDIIPVLTESGEPVTVDVMIGESVFEENIHLIPELGVVRIYGREITNRIKTEKELRLRNEQLGQLNEQLKFLSIRDNLTGLYNRQYFEEELKRLGNMEYWPISILVADVDGLKLVNDTFGAQRGDELLISAAKSFRKPFGTSFVVARIGGDEFAAIMPFTSYNDARKMLLKCEKEIEESNKQSIFPLSMSFGLATSDDMLTTLPHVLKSADLQMYREKLRKGSAVRKAIINSLRATMVERDHMTESHAERLTVMAERFGAAAGLTPGEIEELKTLTLMHDIGKIGVPDRILFKPGPLTPEEREEIQKHSEIGYRIAASTVELESIALFILHHHERWDGKGYPSGLAGENIPLLCRILSILDTFDAMINDRPYRKALTHEIAVKELLKNAGSQFDPSLVEIFVNEIYPLSFTIAV